MIQLKGKKRWTIGSKPTLPMPLLYDQLPRLPAPAANQCEALVLDVGDVLYIPRGVPHCADTESFDEDSLHLTVGVEIEASGAKIGLLTEILRTADPETSRDQQGLHACDVLQLPSQASDGFTSDMRRGIMAWHLESTNRFQLVVQDLLTSIRTEQKSSATTNHKWKHTCSQWEQRVRRLLRDDASLAQVRASIDRARQEELAPKAAFAQMYATLHECFIDDEGARTSDARSVKRRKTVNENE